MSSFLLRVLAAVFVVAAGVVMFAIENVTAFAGLLIVGNLLSLAAHFVERRLAR